MFFLSKVLLFLLFPITWVFVILGLALITYNLALRKRLLILSILFLYLFSCPFVLDAFALFWRIPVTPIKPNSVYSCAILLGGFAGGSYDNIEFFNIHSDRFIQALKLQSSHKVHHLLISGGHGRLAAGRDTEAVWAMEQLRQLNVPDSSIIIESRSKNTIQNALYTKQLLNRVHFSPPYLLVTSDFHMRRAVYIFEKAGIEVLPYSTNFLAGTSNVTVNSFLPKGSTLFYWELYTKEIVGLLVAHLTSFQIEKR